MGWPVCNSTLENETIHEIPVWNGKTFHDLGLLLSAIFSLIAIVVSLYLIFMHATHYLKPNEQRHIIRILFMVPVYAVVSFLSYKYYTHSVYFSTLGDCYEAFAIASFFTLLCNYVAEDLHQQKNYFRTVQPKRWVWPMGWIQKCCGGEKGMWRTPRSGLTWFNVIWSGVFQYCFFRVFFTIVACATQFFSLYCEESISPAFAHIWVIGFEAVTVSIAMYCLIQFYFQLREDIAAHKPLLKLTAIKLVIFLSFWQTIVISLLTSAGAITSGPRFGTADIKVGIPAMLLCIEMAVFSIFHLWAFTWRPYRLKSKQNLAESVPGYSVQASDYQGGFLGYKAIMHAFNPWDLVKAIGRSARWLFVGRKHRMMDSSYDVTRQNTDPSISLDNTTELNPGDPAYKPAGKPGQFAGDEGDELLNHAQMNPASGPPPAYSHNDHYEQYGNPNDIGVARSVYGGDDDSDSRSVDQRSHDARSRGPSPNPPPMPGPGSLEIPFPPSQGQQQYSPSQSPERARRGRYGDEYSGQQNQMPYESYQSYRPSGGRAPAAMAPGTAVPYPESNQNGRRDNRVSMPHAPGQGQHDRTNGGGAMF